MRYSRLYAFLASIAIAGMTAMAEEASSTAYEFLNVTTSSHVYGLGGHNLTIVDDDVNLVEQNPALLGPEYDMQAGVGYMRYLGSSNFMSASFAKSVGEHGAIAFRVQYFGYGSITEASSDGTITGSFNPSDLAVCGTFSYDITDNLRGGITVKYVQSDYAQYSAIALATDLGINYYNPENETSLSLVAKNLGGQLKKFDEENDDLPWDIQAGWSKTLESVPVRLSVTATNLTKWELPYMDREDSNSTTSELVEKSSFFSNLFRHLTLAAEILPSDKIYLGLGYDYKTRTDMTTYSRNFVSGFSLAAGLKTRTMGFGVALAQPHIGGTTFMFNLTVSISEMLH